MQHAFLQERQTFGYYSQQLPVDLHLKVMYWVQGKTGGLDWHVFFLFVQPPRPSIVLTFKRHCHLPESFVCTLSIIMPHEAWPLKFVLDWQGWKITVDISDWYLKETNSSIFKTHATVNFKWFIVWFIPWWST